MTDLSDYETVKDMIVWRCISIKVIPGGMMGFARSEYLYDDYVLTAGLGTYLEEVTQRGEASKITLHREGPFSKVLGSERKQRSGTIRIASQKSIKRLDEFGMTVTCECL